MKPPSTKLHILPTLSLSTTKKTHASPKTPNTYSRLHHTFTFLLLILLLINTLPSLHITPSTTTTTTKILLPEQQNPHLRRNHLSPPSWCATLLKKPKKLKGSGCRVGGPIDDHNCGKTLKPVFPGQKAVDWFLYTQHYRLELWTRMNDAGKSWDSNNGGDDEGEEEEGFRGDMFGDKVYVDLAANHAVRISNTYVFDRCLGMKGVCIEANERYFYELYNLRTCHLVPICVSDKEERVNFVSGMAEGLSGIASTNKNLVNLENMVNKTSQSYRGSYRQLHSKITSLHCLPFAKVLMHSGVTHIDYLNLDVEGHERKILIGIDWSSVEIDIIGIEAPRSSLVHSILKNNGYVKVPGFPEDGEDWLYMKDGFLWGKEAFPKAAQFFNIT